jgi:hypothetical protein
MPQKAPLHSSAYQDFEEKPLIIEVKDEKAEDELCYGESLDLSHRPKTTSSAESIASDELTASTVPHFGSTHLPILPLHIKTAGPFRQGKSGFEIYHKDSMGTKFLKAVQEGRFGRGLDKYH